MFDVGNYVKACRKVSLGVCKDRAKESLPLDVANVTVTVSAAVGNVDTSDDLVTTSLGHVVSCGWEYIYIYIYIYI